jgi:ferredoxin-NADP reductase
MNTTPTWTDALVESFVDLTPTVREFTLAPTQPAQFDAGAHLQVQLLVQGRPQTRSYSLTGQPDGRTYRIAVKRLPQGRGGSLAMWGLQAGERLRISQPQNKFPLSLSAPAYLLVAGGIGVTPLVRMAQMLAQRGSAVHMLLAARTADELAYAPVLRPMLGERLREFVADQGQIIDFKAEIAQLPTGGQMYICGPAPMLDAARRAWESSGRPAADLRFETFGSSGRLASQAFGLEMPRHHINTTVPADCSLLDAIELAGVQAMFNCRRGECGLCAMDVLAFEGEIDHRDVFLSEHEKQQNKRICVCVSRVVGAITLDSAYRPEN